MPHARANGITLEYDLHGDGEPLVLVMGLGAQLIHWPEGLVERFVRRGFKVVRFDNRDSGRSTRFTDAGDPPLVRDMARWLAGLPVPAPYTVADMADDTAGLIDALDLGPAHVLGVSLGGMIAQSLAIRHPGRLRSLISVMSTPGGRRHSIARPRALRELLRPPAEGREQAIEQGVAFARAVSGAGFPVDEAYVRKTAAAAWERDPDPYGARRQLVAILASGKRTDDLRRVRLPTLVLHGAHDPLIPVRAGRATAAAVPGARFETLPGMGHELPAGAWDALVDRVARFTGVAAAPVRRPA